MINRNLLHPRLKSIFYQLEEEPTTPAEEGAPDGRIVDVNAGGDQFHIAASGGDGASITVKTYGRLRITVPEEETPSYGWFLIGTDTINVGDDDANLASPEGGDEFMSALVTFDVLMYDKLRFFVTAVTGPVSLWGGGASVLASSGD